MWIAGSSAPSRRHSSAAWNPGPGCGCSQRGSGGRSRRPALPGRGVRSLPLRRQGNLAPSAPQPHRFVVPAKAGTSLLLPPSCHSEEHPPLLVIPRSKATRNLRSQPRHNARRPHSPLRVPPVPSPSPPPSPTITPCPHTARARPPSSSPRPLSPLPGRCSAPLSSGPNRACAGPLGCSAVVSIGTRFLSAPRGSNPPSRNNLQPAPPSPMAVRSDESKLVLRKPRFNRDSTSKLFRRPAASPQARTGREKTRGTKRNESNASRRRAWRAWARSW